MPIRKKTHQNGGNRPTMQTDKKPQNTTPNPAPDMTLEEHMDLYLNQGTEKKEAMKKVAKDRGIRKRDVYQALLKD